MTGNRGVRTLCRLTFALALLPWTAAAQEAQPPTGPGRGACHADVQRLCNAAKGQPGGVGGCLREHLEELSEPCRAQIQERGAQARGAGQRVRQACADELARFCPDAGPGSGLMRCLRPHESELSEACRAALPQRGGGRGRGSEPPPPPAPE